MNPTEYLDQLDQAREKATPGPWARQNGAPNLVYGDPDVGIFVCNTGYDHVGSSADSLPAADAALIVAAVNALPKLTAALRAVEELTYASDDGTEYEHNGHGIVDGEPECPGCWADGIRTAITTALGGAA